MKETDGRMKKIIPESHSLPRLTIGYISTGTFEIYDLSLISGFLDLAKEYNLNF